MVNQLLSQAAWLIDTGLEAGKDGRQVGYSGILEKSMEDHDSATGPVFKKLNLDAIISSYIVILLFHHL